MPKLTGKAGIRAFLLENIGKIVTTEQVREASGNQVQYSRRMRELRDEEGWKISSKRDRVDLKPNEYVLEERPPEKTHYKFQRNMSSRLRAQVLERNGYTCQMCGIGAGDDLGNGRKATLQVGHIQDKSAGGPDELTNLRTLCSVCNQGAKNIAQEPPSWTFVLSQIRRASISDQRAALDWLKKKFKE